MKKYVGLLALVATVLVAASCSLLVGTGIPESRVWTTTGFSSVEIDQAFTAEIERGDVLAVETVVDSSLGPYVRVWQDGVTLKVGFEGLLCASPIVPSKIRIVCPAIAKVELSNASSATMKGFISTAGLYVVLNNASTFMLVDSALGPLRLDASNSSKFQERLGSVSSAEVQLNNASTAFIRTPGHISGVLNGASTLRYYTPSTATTYINVYSGSWFGTYQN